MGSIASFHLVRESGPFAVRHIARLAFDRPALASTPGLRFWRLLGTGAGSSTGPGADLKRRALFAIWDDEFDLEVFLASSPVVRRWWQAEEVWHVRLRSLGGHGRWRGVEVPTEIERVTQADHGDAPVAIITRADVRARSWRDFAAASPEVDAELHQAPGLIDAVGVGEAPIGRQGTFSLWSSLGAARQFAYSMPRHARVIEQTQQGDWYGEEMFARFAPFASTGTWDGRDPLAG